MRDDKTFHKAQSSALKGNDKAWESIDEALKNPPPKNEENLHETIFSNLGMLQDKNAEKILRKYLQDPNEKKREAAFRAYNRRKKFSSAKETNTQMLQAMQNNLSHFGKWTQTEKNIFAGLDQKTQMNFFKQLKLRYDNKFYLDTLQALLAKELYKAKNKVTTPPSGKVYEDAILQSAFFSYESKKDSDKIFDRITAVYKQNAKQHFIGLAKESSLKKSQQKIVAEYAKKKFGVEIFTPVILAEEKKEIVKILKPKKTKKNLTAALPKPSPKKVKKIIKKTAVKDNGVTKEQLITLAKKYNLDSKVFTGIQQNINSHVHDKNKKAEQRYLFTVIREIYPDKSFFELREKLKEPFQNKTFFAQLMKTIEKENPTKEMQILILRKIGGLNYQDSVSLWKMYKEEFS